MQKSSSPRKIQNKILTFQKTPKHDKTLVYNRKLHSERNKINIYYLMSELSIPTPHINAPKDAFAKTVLAL